MEAGSAGGNAASDCAGEGCRGCAAAGAGEDPTAAALAEPGWTGAAEGAAGVMLATAGDGDVLGASADGGEDGAAGGGAVAVCDRLDGRCDRGCRGGQCSTGLGVHGAFVSTGHERYDPLPVLEGPHEGNHVLDIGMAERELVLHRQHERHLDSIQIRLFPFENRVLQIRIGPRSVPLGVGEIWHLDHGHRQSVDLALAVFVVTGDAYQAIDLGRGHPGRSRRSRRSRRHRHGWSRRRSRASLLEAWGSSVRPEQARNRPASRSRRRPPDCRRVQPRAGRSRPRPAPSPARWGFARSWPPD